MDFGLDLVRGAILSGVKAGDSPSAYALMQGDEAALFAGKAYDAMAAAKVLVEAGIADGIMHRGHPRRRLAPWQLCIALNLRRAGRLDA